MSEVIAPGSFGMRKTNSTYADVLAAPDELVAQLIDGTLYTHARPKLAHSTFVTGLVRATGGLEDGVGVVGGWRFAIEPELHFGADVLVPDLAAWRVERFPEGELDQVNVTVTPDWVCEVLSPTTARLDRVVKLPRYGRAGVSWAWLADPHDRMVEVFRFAKPRWVLETVLADEAAVRVPPFEAIELPLASLWGR